MKRAVIVLPTYNERDNVSTLIPVIFDHIKEIKGWEFFILVVDDNSPDNTLEAVKKLQKTYKNLHVLNGEKKGLGRAYIRGFSYALENLSPDVLFEMDADWSHPPTLIGRFIEKINQGADFVVGSRYIKGGSIPSDWGIHRKIFSYCGNIVIRLGFMNLKIKEWTNGYRAIRADFVKEILSELNPFNGYVFQIAILDRAVKNHLTIVEVPVQFKERKSGESKISSFRYIFDILLYIFLNSTFIKFCIVGFIGFLINLIGLELFYQRGFSPAVAAAMGAELAIISNFILNNFWSFSHKRIGEKSNYLQKFLQFNLVSVGAIIIQFIIVGTGTYYFGDHARFIFLIVAIVFFVLPYSFFMYNNVVWKEKPTKNT